MINVNNTKNKYYIRYDGRILLKGIINCHRQICSFKECSGSGVVVVVVAGNPILAYSGMSHAFPRGCVTDQCNM